MNLHFTHKYSSVATLILALGLLLGCSDKVAGGASETEAGFQFAVVDSNNTPQAGAKVWVNHRFEVSSTIDSTICDEAGICTIQTPPRGQYLLRVETPTLSGMNTITSSGDSIVGNPWDSTQIEVFNPTSFSLQEFAIDTNIDFSIETIRVGVLGFSTWDTIKLDQNFISPKLPQGDHVILIEYGESQQQIPIALTDSTPNFIDTVKLTPTPPTYILLDDFADHNAQTHLGALYGSRTGMWKLNTDTAINGKSVAEAIGEDSIPQSIFNLSMEVFDWGPILSKIPNVDTAHAYGILLPSTLDSTLLPTQRPYTELSTELNILGDLDFENLDSITFLGMGSSEIQIIWMDENKEEIYLSALYTTTSDWIHYSIPSTYMSPQGYIWPERSDEIRYFKLRNYGVIFGFGFLLLNGMSLQ